MPHVDTLFTKDFTQEFVQRLQFMHYDLYGDLLWEFCVHETARMVPDGRADQGQFPAQHYLVEKYGFNL